MHYACTTVITIRNVPEDVNEKLKQRAAERGQSLQQFLLRELADVAERSPLEQRWAAALEGLPRVEVSKDEIVALIEAGRQERDEQIARAVRGDA
jgi:plasmid stability protein